MLQFRNGKISVILSWVNLFSSGLYSCEVSADIPDYDTKIRRQHLHVFGKFKNQILFFDQFTRFFLLKTILKIVYFQDFELFVLSFLEAFRFSLHP